MGGASREVGRGQKGRWEGPVGKVGAGEIGKVEVGGRLEWAKILFLWIIGWGIKRDIVRSL